MLKGTDYVQFLLNESGSEPVDNEIDVDKIKLPIWYNQKLFKKGQKFYTRNLFSMFVGMLCGLIAVLGVSSILKILICTNKSSSNLTAYQRYIRTIFHTVTWHWYSINENNFKETKVFKSLISVRKIHLNSSKYCAAQKAGIISQKDMALTQFGFMGLITLRAESLGLNPDSDYHEATIHFWRVIGYLLGIKDEFNLCTDSWETTKPRLQAVTELIYRPYFNENNKDFQQMVTYLVEGLWSFSPILTVDICLFLTKRLLGCEGYEYLKSDYKTENDEINSIKLYKNMSMGNRARLCFLIYLLEYWNKWLLIKYFFNFLEYLSLFLIYYIPFLAWPRFGFKQSYVRIKIN